MSEYPERIYVGRGFRAPEGKCCIYTHHPTDQEYTRSDLAAVPEVHHAAELQERGEMLERIRVLERAVKVAQLEAAKLRRVVEAGLPYRTSYTESAVLLRSWARSLIDDRDGEAGPLEYMLIRKADALEALTK